MAGSRCVAISPFLGIPVACEIGVDEELKAFAFYWFQYCALIASVFQVSAEPSYRLTVFHFWISGEACALVHYVRDVAAAPSFEVV